MTVDASSSANGRTSSSSSASASSSTSTSEGGVQRSETVTIIDGVRRRVTTVHDGDGCRIEIDEHIERTSR